MFWTRHFWVLIVLLPLWWQITLFEVFLLLERVSYVLIINSLPYVQGKRVKPSVWYENHNLFPPNYQYEYHLLILWTWSNRAGKIPIFIALHCPFNFENCTDFLQRVFCCIYYLYKSWGMSRFNFVSWDQIKKIKIKMCVS